MSISITNEDANAIVESYLKMYWGFYEPKIEVYFDKDSKPFYHVYSSVRVNDKVYKKLTRISLDGFKAFLLQALIEQEKPINRVGLIQKKGNKVSYALHCTNKAKRKGNTSDRAKRNEVRIKSEEQAYRAQLDQPNYAPVFIINNQRKILRQERIRDTQKKKLRKERIGE